MKDMFEEEIKIKINNYMEQIKVPKNLGGIVMEDFEKIKKEESQNITKENIEKTNIQEGEKPKNKTGKLFKISLGSVAAVVLVGVGIIAGTKIVGDKVITIDKNGGQSGSSFVGDNKIKLISTDHLSEYLGDWYSDDASLRIKSFDNDQIKFNIGLYRTAAMDDAIGTLQDKTNAKFTWKFEEKVEVSGLMEFKDDSIIVTFTSSNDKNIPLNYKITFKRENKKLENEENLNNQNDKQTKISLTEEEKHQLQVFLNKPENNPWTLLTYKEPKDVLSHTHNIGLDHEVDAAEILRYSIKFGGYGRGQANIYGAEPGFVSTQEDMNRFFKEKLFESNFKEEEIQKAFKNDYNKNVSGKYTFWVSDSCFTPAIIENCYKTNENTYFVKLDHGQNIELRKNDNGNYLFYSCTGFNGKIGGIIDMDITETEKTELTAFLNEPENNPWTLLTFNGPEDIFNNKVKHGEDTETDPSQILRYSIVWGRYATEQLENPVKPLAVVTQENMNKFFKDKLYNSKFTEEEIQKAFKYDYNTQVSEKYAFFVSDTCYTPVTIVNGRKTYDDRFSLTLNHGQNIMLIKDTDGKYKFYYCIGFDGKIGNVSETNTSNSTNQIKGVKYEFMSADNEAVRGYSKILKIYEFTADNMSFDYNSGFDFTKSTIDRKLEGVAKANDKKQYIFEEHTSGHKYKLVFEFNDAMDLVKIFQYDNDNEMGYFTLSR